jgi:hypothetical protein
LILIQDNPATIFSIATTGAMLMFGQKRSKEIAALAAEQAVPKILVLYHHSNPRDSRDPEGVPGSYNHTQGVAGANVGLQTIRVLPSRSVDEHNRDISTTMPNRCKKKNRLGW